MRGRDSSWALVGILAWTAGCGDDGIGTGGTTAGPGGLTDVDPTATLRQISATHTRRRRVQREVATSTPPTAGPTIVECSYGAGVSTQ